MKYSLRPLHLVPMCLLIYFLQESDSHGRFMKPPNRSSIWRDPQFDSQNPPKNYNDNELFCGSVHQNDNPGTQCGGQFQTQTSCIPLNYK